MQLDVLYHLLAAVDYVQLTLCSSQTFKRFPTCHLYFIRVPPGKRCRKMVQRGTFDDFESVSYVTYLQLLHCLPLVNLCDLTNLTHLKIDGHYASTLVLPPRLETFIGCNIPEMVTLPESLTSLRLRGNKPKQIVGLEKHPNLTVLECGFLRDFDNFEFPPNLVKLQMSAFSIIRESVQHFPKTLRILCIFNWQPWHPKLSLPDSLEELELFSGYVVLFPNPPRNLHTLALWSFEDVSKGLLSDCSALTKIIIHGHLDETAMRTSLEYISRYIPQVTDLSFHSDRASHVLEHLHFAKLQRLTIDTQSNREGMLQLGYYSTLSHLDIQFSTSRILCMIELPPFLHVLQFTQTHNTLDECPFSATLPRTLKKLHVNAGAFVKGISIFVTREHLERLKIVDDRRMTEKDGHIPTRWGQFVIIE